MADDDGGSSFLSRWSRRKVQSRQADAAPEVSPELTPEGTPEVPPDEAAPPPIPVVPTAQKQAGEAVESSELPRPVAESTPPPPTLDDVERLTPDADFSPFVDRLVQPEVRNAAMKKLFTDPHFNVMDGLDTYIDDYSKPDPIPRQWLRQIVQARVLGLLDDEVEEQPRPDTNTALPASTDVVVDVAEVDEADAAGEADKGNEGDEAASSETEPDNPRLHEDTDLPLQQDDAARHGSPRAAADDDADGPRG